MAVGMVADDVAGVGDRLCDRWVLLDVAADHEERCLDAVCVEDRQQLLGVRNARPVVERERDRAAIEPAVPIDDARAIGLLVRAARHAPRGPHVEVERDERAREAHER